MKVETLKRSSLCVISQSTSGVVTIKTALSLQRGEMVQVNIIGITAVSNVIRRIMLNPDTYKPAYRPIPWDKKQCPHCGDDGERTNAYLQRCVNVECGRYW